MAENKRPPMVTDGHDNSPIKRINFATLAHSRHRTASSSNRDISSKEKGAPTISGRALEPMAHDRKYNAQDEERLEVMVDTARMQLISPPPEEMLRRPSKSNVQFTPSPLASSSPDSTPATVTAAKRKRSQPTQPQPSGSNLSDHSNGPSTFNSESQLAEATPNPKPRKQGRHHARTQSIESPTRGSFTSPAQTTTPSRPKPKRVVIQSPHIRNPEADYIPPLPALSLSPEKKKDRRSVLSSRSRRSATPIPPYEPPADVFTPPREVYLDAPSASTARGPKKRNTTPKAQVPAKAANKNRKSLKVVTAVKQEMPDIDLTLPMPPASPTDDPLLLSGPPDPIVVVDVVLHTSPRVRKEISIQADPLPESPEPVLEQYDWPSADLPPSSPPQEPDTDDAEATRMFDTQRNMGMDYDALTEEEGDSMMHVDPADAGVEPVRLFGLDEPLQSGGWSDSDDEDVVAPAADGEEEGEGEYTGRWRMMKVRTKLDPPSSATRGRMEGWGRPISPFPAINRLDFLGEEEAACRMSLEPENPIEEAHVLSAADASVDEADTQSVAIVDPDESFEDEEEEREVREMSIEYGDEDQVNDADTSNAISPEEPDNLEGQPELPSQQQQLVFPFPVLSPIISSRFPSLESFKPCSSSTAVPETPPQRLEALDEDLHIGDVSVYQNDETEGSSGDDDDGGALGLVKISSADPRAAARAAAILKKHDYDCYTKITAKQRLSEAKERRKSHSAVEDHTRLSRLKDVFASGVRKAERKPRLSMGVLGDRVFIPGSPATTLPDLLQQAEADVERQNFHVWNTRTELEGAGERDPYKTPITSRRAEVRRLSHLDERQDRLEETRPWSKADWKLLDACFTDQRLALGALIEGSGEGALAPVDIIIISDVVDKFVSLAGGLKMVEGFGETWSRDNLTERTRALRRKQRSGNVAPPSTPFTPARSVSGGGRRLPIIEVPDFTPLGPRAARPCWKPTPLPPPGVQDAPFQNLPHAGEKPMKVPPSLLAPRYSHLLEEAIAVSQDLPDTSILSERDASPQGTSYSEDVHSASMELTDLPVSKAAAAPSTIGNRVTGFLISYLPKISKQSTSRQPQRPKQPRLPLPPPDVLQKPRGPVATPARPPLPKAKAPKELVQLQPAPQRSTTSLIPRSMKPQRLIELHPPRLSPPLELAPSPRPRRSSGSSVKDLVRGFEELQNQQRQQPRLRKMKSHCELKHSFQSRPQWKP